MMIYSASEDSDHNYFNPNTSEVFKVKKQTTRNNLFTVYLSVMVMESVTMH